MVTPHIPNASVAQWVFQTCISLWENEGEWIKSFGIIKADLQSSTCFSQFYFQGRKSNLINYNGIAFNSEYYEEKLKNNFDSEFCILPSKDRIRDNILNLITDNKNLKIKKINQFFLRDNKGIKVNNFFYLKKFPKTRTNKILRNKISIRNLIKIS